MAQLDDTLRHLERAIERSLAVAKANEAGLADIESKVARLEALLLPSAPMRRARLTVIEGGANAV